MIGKHQAAHVFRNHPEERQGRGRKEALQDLRHLRDVAIMWKAAALLMLLGCTLMGAALEPMGKAILPGIIGGIVAGLLFYTLARWEITETCQKLIARLEEHPAIREEVLAQRGAGSRIFRKYLKKNST